MYVQNKQTTEIQVGEFKGLVIEEMIVRGLNGLKAVKVTHEKITGFEARALVALTMGTGDILKEVRTSVRLAG